jgi:acetoacetyl-CoA synthetase
MPSNTPNPSSTLDAWVASASRGDKPLWTPPDSASQTLLAEYVKQVEAQHARRFSSYPELHQWSIDAPSDFWRSVWRFGGIVGESGDVVVTDFDQMAHASWFPDARLNFAENLLRESSNNEALVFWGEDKVERRLTRQQLRQSVTLFAAALRATGVTQGDRVAAYMPNMPETIVAMLAATSLGAVFTSASPDFGVQGVVDRFGQTTPKVLIACDGYWYNGKAIEISGKLADIVVAIPNIERLIVVPYIAESVDILAASLPRGVSLAQFVGPYAEGTPLEFTPVPFNHPLFIAYSSGTTGVPKCIVHGTGGVLLQHVKEHQLHSDIREGDRLFYYTTCGWMMWNWLASSLASGATLMLYDGNPFIDHGRILWDYAERERITHFGTSAKYLDALAKAGAKPGESGKLDALRVILATGSPLAPESFDYVYESVKRDVQLSSISGGTDILSCFVLGNPLLPVWRAEIQCAGLGLAVDVWADDSRPVKEQKGELVCTRPFPSMPLGFWNDTTGERYRSAYFERFPGVWCQGDFCERTKHDGFVIYGRSDATLNPGGVRIGTAEIYRQVERLPEILEAVVIGQNWQNDVRIILFVKLDDGIELTEELVSTIKRTIRENTTPRHVPAKILQVTDIPRTKTGKVVEIAVRNAVEGDPIRNSEALQNAEALTQFKNRVELQE